MEEEKKTPEREEEQALPVQELPADIPAEVRQKLAEDLNEEATFWRTSAGISAGSSCTGRDASPSGTAFFFSSMFAPPLVFQGWGGCSKPHHKSAALVHCRA